MIKRIIEAIKRFFAKIFKKKKVSTGNTEENVVEMVVADYSNGKVDRNKMTLSPELIESMEKQGDLKDSISSEIFENNSELKNIEITKINTEEKEETTASNDPIIEESSLTENDVKEDFSNENINNISSNKEEEDHEMVVKNSVVINKSPVKFTEFMKTHIADELRPIVKCLNCGDIAIHKEYMGEDVKVVKTYVSLVDDDTLCICKFTQSDAYNRNMTNLVKNYIFPAFMATPRIPGCADIEFEYEIEDGKIKIRAYKIDA